MRGTVQDIVHALLGAAVSGGAVLPTGASAKQVAMAAVAGAACEQLERHLMALAAAFRADPIGTFKAWWGAWWQRGQS